jgi:hypothetical protein
MTEIPAQAPQAAPPAPPAAQQPGIITRLEERFLPHAEAALRDAEADGLKLTAGFSGALQAHSGTVFSIAGEVTSLLELVDPADDAVVKALASLLPKVYSAAGSAAALAQAALGKVVQQG